MTQSGLPTTFVPGRNLVFLTFASALAYRRGLRHLVVGVCETDYSGYPDCRDDTVKAMQVALNLGMESRFVLHTPLMWIDKAQTWHLVERIGGLALLNTSVNIPTLATKVTVRADTTVVVALARPVNCVLPATLGSAMGKCREVDTESCRP